MGTKFFPPGPRSIFFPLQLKAGLHSAPLAFIKRLTSTYGNTIYFKVPGAGSYYFFNEPEHIQQVLITKQKSFHKGDGFAPLKSVIGNGLLTSEGELHLRQRRMIQPTFHRQRIAGYADTISSIAERVVNTWQDGATLDMFSEMSYLTMLIVNKTLFSIELESEAKELGSTIGTLSTSHTYIIGPLGNLRMRLPLAYTKKILAARAYLEKTVYEMIAKRRVDGDQGDLLSMLIEAQDEENENEHMSDRQVRDEALTLFVAGNDTTTNALTWALYLLSQNPQVTHCLHDELDHVLGGRTPSYADIESLPYTRMVFSETLRLYPPAWIMLRASVENIEIGNYFVPKGSSVILSQWVTHHNEHYYPNPFKFDPERWTPQAIAARPKMSYFPFGGGARACIGEAFAWMEGILVIATIAQKWEFHLETGFPVELLAEITLRPKHGMRMILKRR